MSIWTRFPLVSATLVFGLSALSAPVRAESLATALGGEILPDWQFEEARQYDFWLGEWRGNWRGRQEGEFYNEDSGEWTRAWLFTVLDGKAMVEIARGEGPYKGQPITQGFSIRYYDSKKERWVMAQNWGGPNSSSGFLDQLQGFYRHGQIQLYSGVLDSDGNRSVQRYTFSDFTPKSVRWTNDTTTDSGTTWTAGTILELHRTAETASLPAVGAPLPDSPDGTHCDLAEFKQFDFLQGSWEGKAQLDGGKPVPARLVATGFNNGCSVLSLLRYPFGDTTYKLLQATTYGSKSEMWWVYQLDNRLETAHQYRLGTMDDEGRLVLNANPDLTIADDFSPPAWADGIVPEIPTERTVWTFMTPERVKFELQTRVSGGDWHTASSFDLEKVAN